MSVSFLVDEDINQPKENEIFFTHETSCGFPIMMWKYPQPRVITQVSVLPVPFHFPSDSKVICLCYLKVIITVVA